MNLCVETMLDTRRSFSFSFFLYTTPSSEMKLGDSYVGTHHTPAWLNSQ